MPEVARGDMLLVAESLVEGRILLKRFKKYGLAVDWSREGTQALAMLKAHPYRVVAIDRLKGEPDAILLVEFAGESLAPQEEGVRRLAELMAENPKKPRQISGNSS